MTLLRCLLPFCNSTVLAALRDDTRYALDPLRLRITLSTPDQFVQVAQGGQAFQVLPAQVFSISSIEVTA